MRARLPRITYGNVVSTLALFIALGGVSYAAATLPKNSVGAAQLKKNAVTSKKIKDKSITGSDIKNGTIKGSKIKLSSLGTVPSAASAASADSWNQSSGPLIKRVGPSADNASAVTAQAQATPVTLASTGTITVYGKCYTSGSSLYYGVFVSTSANGAIASVSGGTSYYGNPYLDTTTAESTRYLVPPTSAGTGSVTATIPPFIGFGTFIGPDGKGLSLRVNAYAKNGDVVAGNGPYGVGQSCLFTASGEKFNVG